MFRTNSNDISEFTDVVSFLSVLVGELIPAVTFPKQKLWVDRHICVAVNTCTAVYREALKSGDMTGYRAASYKVQ